MVIPTAGEVRFQPVLLWSCKGFPESVHRILEVGSIPASTTIKKSGCHWLFNGIRSFLYQIIRGVNVLVYIDNMTPSILFPDNFFYNNVKPKSNRENRQKDFRGYSLQIYPLICQNIKPVIRHRRILTPVPSTKTQHHPHSRMLKKQPKMRIRSLPPSRKKKRPANKHRRMQARSTIPAGLHFCL